MYLLGIYIRAPRDPSPGPQMRHLAVAHPFLSCGLLVDWPQARRPRAPREPDLQKEFQIHPDLRLPGDWASSFFTQPAADESDSVCAPPWISAAPGFAAARRATGRPSARPPRALRSQ